MGDGAGEGKNGLHELSGFPHRSKFPANEESGKIDNVCGIEPLSLLLDTLKLAKGAEMLGSVPEKLLFSKSKPVKRVSLLIENGIGPVKLLNERSRRVNRVN